MKPSILKRALTSAALLLSFGLPLPAASQASAAAAAPKAKASASAAQVRKRPPTVKPVDINSAGKTELMKLPGITESDAEKIIAGRPYLTKAHLVTHNIIPAGLYHGIKTMIVAKQKAAPKRTK